MIRTKYTNSSFKNDIKRNLPTKSEKDISEQLGFFDLAKNLKNSLISWHKAGYPVVTRDEWSRRLAICRSCNYWEEFKKTQVARCNKCGCSSGKLLLKTSKCPLTPPKW